MIYCPKCHEPVSEIICPNCSTDVFNYSQQRNCISDMHINALRSDHRQMSNLERNQTEMISILDQNVPPVIDDFDVYMVDTEDTYFCVKPM